MISETKVAQQVKNVKLSTGINTPDVDAGCSDIHLSSQDLELIQSLHSNLECLSEMTDRLGFMMREIQYLIR